MEEEENLQDSTTIRCYIAFVFFCMNRVFLLGTWHITATHPSLSYLFFINKNKSKVIN